MDQPSAMPTIIQASVVILPLPAQGHLNQLLHLAHHLSGCHIPVHYVGSTIHNRQARDRSNGQWEPTKTPNLHFHDFAIPPYPSPPPNSNSPSNFPSHLQPAFSAAVRYLAAPLSSLLHSISSTCHRVILIHDSTMSFATNVASSIANAESYVFHSVSAYANLFFHLEIRHKVVPSSAKSAFKDCFTEEFMEFIRGQHKMTVKDHGRILNTCRAIEREFVDRLMTEPNWKDQKVFTIGPLNPIIIDNISRRARHECLDWLDHQSPKSVVYVSFGTCSSLPKRQIIELAKGLESSKLKYIWVLREADRGDIYFSQQEESDKELEQVRSSCHNGIVIRGWAPQLEILAHRAVGGFLSHCGWNSCIESMSMGVPIMTWPMHSDQPRNSMLVSRVLKVGIVVRDWAKRNEILREDEIRNSILRLMVGDQGKEIAKRAKEVGEVIRECGRKKEELEAFVAHITR